MSKLSPAFELILSIRLWLAVCCVVVQLKGWSDAWALRRDDLSSHGNLGHLITYAFAHSGWVHLVLNLWVLLNFSPLVERKIGRVLFFVLFLISSVSGALLEFLMDPSANVLVGASAGICGIVALCLLQNPTLGVIVVFFDLSATWALIVLCWVSLLLAEWNLVSSILAHWAHIGGLMTGIGAFFLFARRREYKH